MNKEQYIVSEAGTHDLQIDKISEIEIVSNASQIVRTFTSDTIFNEGGSIEHTSQEKTQNAVIEQNIQQNRETEMQPGRSPVALNEDDQNPMVGANYLMQSLMKIRDQAKKREASRKIGAAESKYGKVKSVVAKNKKITKTVAQLKSTLGKPDWNDSTVAEPAPMPAYTPKSSKVSLKPPVPKHVVLGSLAKETFLQSQQDRKNLTMLSPKNSNFRSQIKITKEQYKSPYKYTRTKASQSVVNFDKAGDDLKILSPKNESQYETSQSAAVKRTPKVVSRNVSPTFKERPKGSYLEMTKSRMGKLVDQGILNTVKNQKSKRFNFAISPTSKKDTPSSTKNMLSETAFGSKKSLKNLDKSPDLKMQQQAFSGETFASKKTKKPEKKNKKRPLSASFNVAKGNRSISKLADLKENHSTIGNSQPINKFEDQAQTENGPEIDQMVDEPINVDVEVPAPSQVPSMKKSQKRKSKKPKLTPEQIEKRAEELRQKQQQMKEESKQIQDEFDQLMGELTDKRTNKNDEFYSQILDADYGNLSTANPDKPQKSKTQQLLDSRAAKQKQKLAEAKASLMLPGQESVPENYLDVNIGLAQKDPLAFIDSVLTHHGQKV